MGSGKSTGGRLPAAELGWAFSDVDPEMERRDGETRRNAATGMAGLAEKRKALYGLADHRIDNDGLTADAAIPAPVA